MNVIVAAASSSNTLSIVALVVAGLTAVLTLVMAGATLKSANATEKAATATETAAGATQKAAEAADREATATVDLVTLGQDQQTRSYLPLLLPRAHTVNVQRIGTANGLLIQPSATLDSVGVGPAIGVRMDALFIGGPAPPDPDRISAYTPAIPQGQHSSLHLNYHDYEYAENGADFTITYADVLRTRYQTSFSLSGNSELSNVVVDRLDAQGKRIERIVGEGG